MSNNFHVLYKYIILGKTRERGRERRRDFFLCIVQPGRRMSQGLRRAGFGQEASRRRKYGQTPLSRNMEASPFFWPPLLLTSELFNRICIMVSVTSLPSRRAYSDTILCLMEYSVRLTKFYILQRLRYNYSKCSFFLIDTLHLNYSIKIFRLLRQDKNNNKNINTSIISKNMI